MFTCIRLFNFLSIFIVCNLELSSGYGFSKLIRPKYRDKSSFKSLILAVRSDRVSSSKERTYFSDSYAPWVDWKNTKSLTTSITDNHQTLTISNVTPLRTSVSSTSKSYAPWIDWKNTNSLTISVTKPKVMSGMVYESIIESSISKSYAPWINWKNTKSSTIPVIKTRGMSGIVSESTTVSSTSKSYAPWIDWKNTKSSTIPVTKTLVASSIPNMPSTVPKSTTNSYTSKSYAPWVDWKSIKSITAPSPITESLAGIKSTLPPSYIEPNTANSKSDGRSWLPWTIENSPKDSPSVTSPTSVIVDTVSKIKSVKSNILSYAPGSWRKRSSESVSDVATAASPLVSTVLKSEMVKSDGRSWVPWAQNSHSKSTFFIKNTGSSVIFAEKQLNSEIQKKESVRVNDFDWSPAARASLSTMTLTSSLNQPNKFFKDVVGKAVIIKLNDGIEYRGILVCVDGYLNTAMDQTEEYENGILKAKLGSCFIDGNNVLQLEKDHNSIIYSS